MKKAIPYIALLVALCLVAIIAFSVDRAQSAQSAQPSDTNTVVTSFFPIYLFALNLTDGIDGLDVVCLTPPTAGCLHDYQLQTGDMKKLAQADVFLINGAGMESYLTQVMNAFPDLPQVDASQNVPLLDSCVEHDHGGEEEAHEGHSHEVNAHIWLDAENAILMVQNLAEGLIAQFPQYREAIQANRDAYLLRLQALDEELTAGLQDLPRKDIVTFHESFPYFAEAYGLHVAAVLNREPDDALTPRTMAELCKTVQALDNPPLFTEPQYTDTAAQVISRETGAPVYTLDPIVTSPDGAVPLTWYETAMRSNMAILQEALK